MKMRRVVLLAGVVLLTAGIVAAGELPHANAAKPPPSGTFTLTVDTGVVDFGGVDPEVDVAVPGAVNILVSGFKAWGTLETSFEATNFQNTNPGAGTPTMPVGVMRYAVSGDATVAETPMLPASTFGSVYIDSTDITKNNWDYSYTFDFTLNAPFDYEAGTYTSSIVYTAVLQ